MQDETTFFPRGAVAFFVALVVFYALSVKVFGIGVPQLLDRRGCTACHSTDGSASTGPTFKGLYGSKRVLETGQSVTADETYLRESIEHPEAKVVKTFAAVMPQLPMPPADENAIVEYVKTLR